MYNPSPTSSTRVSAAKFTPRVYDAPEVRQADLTGSVRGILGDFAAYVESAYIESAYIESAYIESV